MPNEPLIGQKTEKKFSYNSIEAALGNTGKIIPQALNFEKAVLGALMIDKDAITNVVDSLRANMFYKESHQAIYEAIFQLFRADEPIDLLTVADQLRANKKLEFAGGAAYLSMLTNQVASAANIEYHARIIMERYVLRQLISICGDISKQAYDEPKDVMDVLDKAETELFNIIENNFSRESKLLSTVVRTTFEELKAKQTDEEGAYSVRSGLRMLDEKTGGWQNSDLIILAARPGMGKTSFVLSIARNAAIEFDKKVAFFSLEMSAQQLAHRLFAIESGIDASKISKGKLTEDEWRQLMDRTQNLNTSNLIIDDTPALSIFDLRAKCRRLKHRYGIDLIIIDYLQLMQVGGEDGKRSGNREQEISQISRSLKALAKDLNVPVIALAQLSRQVEVRGGDKIPQLSDLRESGSIEQDADQVMFIYRPEYYHFEQFSDGTPSHGKADLIIAKNRHGSGGNVRLRFISQFTKFADDIEIGEDADHTNGLSHNNEEFVTFESSMNQDNVSDIPFLY